MHPLIVSLRIQESPTFGPEQSGDHSETGDLRLSLSSLEILEGGELIGTQNPLRMGEELPVELLFLERGRVDVFTAERRGVTATGQIPPA